MCGVAATPARLGPERAAFKLEGRVGITLLG